MEIRLAGLEPESIVDGPGYRFTVFVQGCPHNCPGCHNPQTHDFSGGHLADTDDVIAHLGMRLLSAVDVLVDGPFRSHERSLDLLYRGSKNQRLIDMPATLKGGTIRLYAPPEW